MKPRLVEHRWPRPKVYAVSMVKNEADIIGTTIVNLLGHGVDHVIVADNDSDDATPDVLARLREATGRVTVVQDHEQAYYQARKMTALAGYAADQGAEWIIPFDADEVWYPTVSSDFPSILMAVDPEALWVEVGMVNHYCTSEDVPHVDPVRRMVFAHNDVNPLPKVAFRWRPGVQVGMGNHDVQYPSIYEAGPGDPGVGIAIRHFPYRSEDHFVRKARTGSDAYAATDLDPMYGEHWRNYGRILDVEGEEALRAVFREHFFYTIPSESMRLDPAPLARGLWLA